MMNITLSAFADEISPDLEVQIKVLKAHGMNHIEMRGVDGRSFSDYTVDEAKTVKARLDANGFALSAVGSPIGKIGINEPFEPHLEQLKHVCRLAHVMETSYIRMFSFFIPKGEAPEKYKEAVFDRMGRMAEVAKSEDVILAHENEKGIYGDTAARCLELFKAFYGDHFKCVFDPANFVQCDDVTWPEGFAMLKPYLAYMHIKDARAADHKVVPPGYGDGKLKEIIGELKRDNFSGVFSIEPHLKNFTGFAALEQDGEPLPEAGDGPGLFHVAFKALERVLAIEN